MAGKFHVRNNGDVGPCKANIECPLGADTPHFDTKEKALKYIEENEAKKNSTFNSLSSGGSSNGGVDNGVKTTFSGGDGEDDNIEVAFDNLNNIKEQLKNEEGYTFNGEGYTSYLMKNSDGSYYSGIFHHRGVEADTGADLADEDEESFDTLGEAIEKLNKNHDMYAHPEDYMDF